MIPIDVSQDNFSFCMLESAYVLSKVERKLSLIVHERRDMVP
jgi:hypothetical protein